MMAKQPQSTDLLPPHDPQGPVIVSIEDIRRQCGKEAAELSRHTPYFSPNQLFLYCVTYRAVAQLRRYPGGRLIQWDGILLMIACWLTIFLSSLLSQLLTNIVAAGWTTMFLVATIRGMKIGSPKAITFPNNARDKLLLGYIWDAFGSKTWLVWYYIQNIVELAVLQLLLIWYTTNHLGIGDLSFRDAVLLTLDTFSQSVSFGLFEQYHPQLTPVAATLPTFAATIFFLFKVCYIGYGVWIVAAIWKRLRRQVSLRRVPRWGDIQGFMDWLQSVTTPTHTAMSQYLDDFVFFLLLREYLQKNFDTVRYLADHFSPVLIANSVRSLFVDPTKRGLLFPLRKSYVDDNMWTTVSPH